MSKADEMANYRAGKKLAELGITLMGDAIDQMEAGILRTAASSGEEAESSPPKLPFWWAPWEQWRKDVNEMLEQLQRRMNEVEQRAHSGMCRIQRLEAGPPSPPITAKDTTHSHLDAEPCPICQLPQESGPHRHPMAPAPEPDSPPECTDPATPSSSLSGQSTTPTFRVEHNSESAPFLVYLGFQELETTDIHLYKLMVDDVLLGYVQIVVRDAPASPSGST